MVLSDACPRKARWDGTHGAPTGRRFTVRQLRTTRLLRETNVAAVFFGQAQCTHKVGGLNAERSMASQISAQYVA